MTEKKVSLLPCPFCGSDEISHGYDYVGIYQSVVQCHADGCGAAIVLQGQSEDDAITAWNTRHSSEEGRLRGQEAVCDAVHEALWKADAEVARLREALEDIATIKRSAYEAARIARTALSGSTLMEGMGE